MPLLPAFTADGVLPPGDYELTLEQLEDSILVRGSQPDPPPHWDAEWRLQLLANLRIVGGQLWAVGIDEVVDGSFAEDKDHPNDIDGYFACDPARYLSGESERELNRIDPEKSWTWDHNARRRYRGYAKLQLPMWHAYRVELYPHFPGLFAGEDEHGQPLEFPAYSRKRRDTGMPKGIVKLIRQQKEGVGS